MSSQESSSDEELNPSKHPDNNLTMSKEPSAPAQSKKKATGAKGPREAFDFLSVGGWIDAARATNPAFRYALFVGGVCALLVVFLQFGNNPAAYVFGAVIVAVLMVLFFVISQAVRLTGKIMSPAAIFLVWAFLLLAVATAVLIFTSTFFNFPLPLRDKIIPSVTPGPVVTPPKSDKVDSSSREISGDVERRSQIRSFLRDALPQLVDIRLSAEEFSDEPFLKAVSRNMRNSEGKLIRGWYAAEQLALKSLQQALAIKVPSALSDLMDRPELLVLIPQTSSSLRMGVSDLQKDLAQLQTLISTPADPSSTEPVISFDIGLISVGIQISAEKLAEIVGRALNELDGIIIVEEKPELPGGC